MELELESCKKAKLWKSNRTWHPDGSMKNDPREHVTWHQNDYVSTW